MLKLIKLYLFCVRICLNLFYAIAGRSVRIDRFFVFVDVRARVHRKGGARARALVLHRAGPVLWSSNDSRFLGHSIDWEAREIVRQIHARGYEVDVVNAWSPLIEQMTDRSGYDLIFDENGQLPRFLHTLAPGATKILYFTGSYPRFHNEAELGRVRDLRKRRGASYFPRRVLRAEQFDLALEVADGAVLVGNAVTHQTFPKRFRRRILPVRVSASIAFEKTGNLCPDEREFLWFFGEGAVHKGLDLLLEVFSKHPEWVLNIVGNVERERDFFEIYSRELEHTANIRYHGFLQPSSRRFRQIVERSFCFVAPTCSEGISPAVATCIHAGLYPVISRNSGVTLPDKAGMYIEPCNISTIEKRLAHAFRLPAGRIEEEIARCQAYAGENFSREAYSADLDAALSQLIPSASRITD